MGTDAYARTTVGFLFNPDELWAEEVAAKATCPKGHDKSGDPSAKFCAKCGAKYTHVRKRVATAAFKRFCKEHGHGNTKETFEALGETYDSTDLGFHNVRQVTSSEDRGDDRTMVLGFRLSGTGSWRGFGGSETVSVTMEGLNEAVLTLTKLRECLGVPDREIRLYTSLYISV